MITLKLFNELTTGLKKIADPSAPYSIDPLNFAQNTIVVCQEYATQLLDKMPDPIADHELFLIEKALHLYSESLRERESLHLENGDKVKAEFMVKQREELFKFLVKIKRSEL